MSVWKLEENMTYEEFKEKYVKNSENSFEGKGLAESLKQIQEDCNGFNLVLICKKCASRRVQVIGEDGYEVSEVTGYASGSNVFKCLDCGNAITIWK